jgi:putative hydrolase of the HAD superfamily
VTPRAVVFDAGNTLIYVDARRVLAVLREAGVLTDLVRVRAAELEARRGFHRRMAEGRNGTEPELWREYFVTLLRLAGVADAELSVLGQRLRETHAGSHLWTHVEPGTEEALQALLDAGYRLAVVSNADGRVEAVLEEVRLRRYFEFVLDSDIVGVEKPHPGIFLAACRRLGLEPRACTYVGDLYEVDYLGATATGMRAVLLDPLGLYGARAPTVLGLAQLRPWLELQASEA